MCAWNQPVQLVGITACTVYMGMIQQTNALAR